MVKLTRGLCLSSFRREWLAKDIVAGAVLTTLLVPRGYRRCARDRERLPARHEAAVYWAMITIMARRLAGEARRS
jgi:hypothetical protein